MSIDLATVDLLDPGFYASQRAHAVWAAMRTHAPLHHQAHPGADGFWSVTRHADACRVLGNHQEFTSERGTLLHQLGRSEAAAGRMLVATDPPRHTELRRPLGPRFAARAFAAVEGRVRRAVYRVLSPAREPAEWDLAERIGELPMAVAGDLLGLPEQDWPDLVRWTGMAAAPDDPGWRQHGGPTTLAIAHHELFEYFSRQIRGRPDAGRDGLLRHLATMRIGAARLTREEVIFNCYSVLLGANATTPHTVAGTVQALIEHEEQYATVRADPSLVPRLVEEGLRWTSPAMSFLRHAVRDARFDGGVVRRGEPVAVWIGAANRDETVFPAAAHFDVLRTANPHIAFGFGPHYCLGAALARLTLRVFFAEALRLVSRFELTEPPTYLRSNFIAGFTHLVVRTRPGPAWAAVSRKEEA